ncbi:MAG: ribonuclease III [Kiritimatiellae bacterium]|nr:ribonuclease III [Kiritimatiellia bacterium]
MRNPYKPLEAALGYRFRRRARLEMALTHPSYRYEDQTAPDDNQRIEFLGDAVLGLIAAEHLFRRFHEMREGELTKLRSQIASSKALAHIAEKIELGKYLRLGRGEDKSGGAERPSNLADALEAILGAAYLDGGMKAACRIFNKLFAAELDQMHGHLWAANPKGALQEYAQDRWKMSPHYRIVHEDGPAHSKNFTAEVLVNGRVCGSGRGANKRTAEVAAARAALSTLRAEDR